MHLHPFETYNHLHEYETYVPNHWLAGYVHDAVRNATYMMYEKSQVQVQVQNHLRKVDILAAVSFPREGALCDVTLITFF